MNQRMLGNTYDGGQLESVLDLTWFLYSVFNLGGLWAYTKTSSKFLHLCNYDSLFLAHFSIDYWLFLDAKCERGTVDKSRALELMKISAWSICKNIIYKKIQNLSYLHEIWISVECGINKYDVNDHLCWYDLATNAQNK